MVCIGFEPGAAEWKVHLNPLSYSGAPKAEDLCDGKKFAESKHRKPTKTHFPSLQNIFHRHKTFAKTSWFAYFGFMKYCKKARPTPAPFCLFSFFSKTILTERTVRFIGIWSRIVGVEGEYADHLTTTTALQGIPCFHTHAHYLDCTVISN